MKIKFFTLESTIELIPSIIIWWKPKKGIAIGWLMWALEIRED